MKATDLDNGVVRVHALLHVPHDIPDRRLVHLIQHVPRQTHSVNSDHNDASRGTYQSRVCVAMGRRQIRLIPWRDLRQHLRDAGVPQVVRVHRRHRDPKRWGISP